MENVRRKVFLLTFVCVLLYFFVSLTFEVLGLRDEPFSRINLVSDIVKRKDSNSSEKKHLLTNKDISEDKGGSQRNFDFYKKPNLITNFNVDNEPSLPKFVEKLQQLKKGKNIKIRIAYLGDSMIEGDLITQTLRELLQKEYGGQGVGFLPIFSNVGGFRQTAKVSSNGWTTTNFMSKKAQDLYLSGSKFTGSGSGTYTDNTIKGENIRVEKSIIYAEGVPEISVNDTPIELNGDNKVNRQVLLDDESKTIKIAGRGLKSPIFGISFESKKGVFVDNFSFRGITGVELKKLSEDFMKSIQQANKYDLIIVQYGVNLLFRPKDTDYTYYYKSFEPTLQQMKSAFSGSEILIIGSADRAFRYNGVNKTAIGLPYLIENQALIAYRNGFAFYNQFETMGGENSIVKWAEQTPPKANKDYIHPNHRGAEFLGRKLFDAIQKDYQQISKNTQKSK